MKLYRLSMPRLSGRGIVNFRDPKWRLAGFFIWDEMDERSVVHAVPTGVAVDFPNFAAFSHPDYLAANIGIPIFSERAAEILYNKLANELKFYKCIVECGGESKRFMLAKTLKYLPLIDESLSDFRNLTDGERALTVAKYNTYSAEDFYIARDNVFRGRLVVSQLFVDLCKQEKLDISFAEPV